MSERDYAPLSIACVRGLCDKIYEKRKFAGAEIEKMVKDFNDANNSSQIKRLIRVLGQDLMSSTNPNVKNGALMGLSSVAVGLGKGCINYLPELTHPIIACFSESESRVRYQAAEALFNVLKIARGASLTQFPIIFDALARLAADPEPQVKQGAELLDRLVKDIVTESGGVEVRGLVGLVRERMYARGAAGRQWVVSWVAVLDGAPHAHGPLLARLPALLDPLLLMLGDPNPEIRRMCDIQLNEFLRSIKKDPSSVDFQAMINILITHAQSPEELIQLTAITWIKEFVELAGVTMLPYASGILCAVLPCLAYSDEPRKSIRETAATVNFQLTKLVVSEKTPESSPPPEGEGPDVEPAGSAGREGGETPAGGVAPAGSDAPAGGAEPAGSEAPAGGAAPAEDEAPAGGEAAAAGAAGSADASRLKLGAVVDVLTQMLHHSSVHTKVAVLDWILHLYNKLPAQMLQQTDKLFMSVVGCLTDPSDDVVRQSLAVLAEVCSCGAPAAPAAAPPADPAAPAAAALPSVVAELQPDDLESNPYYYKFLQALLKLLAADDNLLEDRGAFIIRQLCALLSAERVYVALSAGARRAAELPFAAAVVDVLATLLLTAAELFELRAQLRTFARPTRALFAALYVCWCHSPVSLLALCLLTHNYRHCNRLIATFGDLEITVDFLTEVDKLVQLIESPIFAYLRLELLGARSAELRAALYGLLMLLPQSAAFHTLRKRLQCVPAAPAAPAAPAGTGAGAGAGEEAEAEADDIDFDGLLEEFKRVQAAHRRYRMLHRARAQRL